MIYIMKQDKRKGWIGITIVALIFIIALIVALRASRNAANNFEERKIEAQNSAYDN